jgi:hypothetical protein
MDNSEQLRMYEDKIHSTRNKLKIGKAYRIFFSEGNFNNKRIHIRAFVDDNVVYCQWFKRKQMWLYYIENLYVFSLYFENKNIKQA